MGVMCIRTLFLTSVAALFLATGTAPSAYAEEPQLGLFWLKDDPSGHWENQRQDCSLIWIAKDKEDGPVLGLKEILELQKEIPRLKQCEAWHKCLEDRDKGKVKHCYERDRRWWPVR